jgi:hypothetical protein
MNLREVTNMTMPDKIDDKIHCIFLFPDEKPIHDYILINNSSLAYSHKGKMYQYFIPSFYNPPLVFRIDTAFPINPNKPKRGN